jgi:hypothetical protein
VCRGQTQGEAGWLPLHCPPHRTPHSLSKASGAGMPTSVFGHQFGLSSLSVEQSQDGISVAPDGGYLVSWTVLESRASPGQSDAREPWSPV